MADETKPLTAAQIAAKKLQEQQQANAQAAAKYQSLVGKTFSNGKRSAAVKEYVPSRLTKDGPRQQFLVNFGNPNINNFFNCLEFTQQFTTEVTEQPAAQPATTHLPQ